MTCNPVGSVWWNDADDFTLLIIGEGEACLDGARRLITLVLDNGQWPTPAGRLYKVHPVSLHEYYTRIA